MACFRQFSRRIIVEGGELAYSEEESCIENWDFVWGMTSGGI